MKKIFYIPLLLLTMVIGINKVSADNSIYMSHLYDDYASLTTIDSSIVSNLETYYTTNFSSSYSYYYIYYNSTSNILSLATTSNNELWVYGSTSNYNWGSNRNGSFPCYSYNFSTTSYSTTCTSLTPTLIYKTNVDFIYDDPNVSSTFSSMQTPLYSNLSLGVSFPQYDVKHNYIIPTYSTLSTGSYVAGPIGSTGNSGLIISDLFTNPIEALKSVWDSIVGIFNLIGEFIALIPTPLKEFLIASFMLAIILGILKIIL